MAEGFKVEIMRMIPNGFIDLSRKDKGYLRIADCMQAQYEQSYIFRFVLPDDG
ncbi:MAG: hypothetical protein K6U74_09860 [Firmicutes bacterium]|nr:hypothetical protein [Bacillota bacterium]